MKNVYQTPVVEIEYLETEDVLKISVSEDKGSLDEIEWDDISLQDITQEAQAALYRAQAEKYRAEAMAN